MIVSETVGSGVFFDSGEAASAVTQPLNNAVAVTAIVNVSVILNTAVKTGLRVAHHVFPIVNAVCAAPP